VIFNITLKSLVFANGKMYLYNACFNVDLKHAFFIPRKQILNKEILQTIMKLKICGLTTIEDIECVNAASVDYAGFVFAKGHRQELTVETAKKFRAVLSPNILAVGVFIDEPKEFIEKLIEHNIINAVQFHGKNEFKLTVPTMRGIVIKTKEDIKPTNCDYVIFDSHWNGAVGSSGGSFDWRLIENYKQKPFFLAGGINITNIEKALSFKPHGIDISSGVETDGKKNLTKILEIKNAIKNYCK